MECQNVNYVVKLFDEKNGAALQNLNITNHEPVCNSNANISHQIVEHCKCQIKIQRNIQKKSFMLSY